MIQSSVHHAMKRPHRRWPTVALAIVFAVGALVVTSKDHLTLADSQPASQWTTSAVVSQSTVVQGGKVQVTIQVKAPAKRLALIDLEIHTAKGKVFQRIWDHTYIRAGETRTFTASWTVPANAVAGKHIVKIGVFGAWWNTVHAWNDHASLFNVAPSTTLPTTTATTLAPATTATTVAPATTATTLAPATTATTVAPTTTATTVAPTTTATTVAPTTTATTVAPTTTPTTPAPTTNVTTPPGPVLFSEDFQTTGGFYDRFDYGYSGPDPQDWAPGGNFLNWRSDHSSMCEAPGAGADRTISVGGHTDGHTDSGDFADLFYHCAPGGDPAKGHVMTSVQTVSYNIAWFSPKPVFTNVRRVCWDQNMTDLGKRKWTQVLFVAAGPGQDATRYPNGVGESRAGSGGYDLGYTSPEFRADAPNTGIFPQNEIAGVKWLNGSVRWFQGQAPGDSFTSGGSGFGDLIDGVTDERVRYRQCMTERSNGILFEQDTPNGTRSFLIPGAQIPNGPVRVVFQDDNYDPPKDGQASDDHLTRHWDNIEIG